MYHVPEKQDRKLITCRMVPAVVLAVKAHGLCCFSQPVLVLQFTAHRLFSVLHIQVGVRNLMPKFQQTLAIQPHVLHQKGQIIVTDAWPVSCDH